MSHQQIYRPQVPPFVANNVSRPPFFPGMPGYGGSGDFSRPPPPIPGAFGGLPHTNGLNYPPGSVQGMPGPNTMGNNFNRFNNFNNNHNNNNFNSANPSGFNSNNGQIGANNNYSAHNGFNNNMSKSYQNNSSNSGSQPWRNTQNCSNNKRSSAGGFNGQFTMRPPSMPAAPITAPPPAVPPLALTRPPPPIQSHSHMQPQQNQTALTRPPPPVFNSNMFAPSLGSGPPSCESFPYTNNTQQQQPRNNNGRGGWVNRGRGRGTFNRGGGSGSFSNNGKQFKQKKQKVDKRDLPENNKFYCDICDRGSKTEEQHLEHVAGHIKCSYKDCPFVASPKLVQLHVNLQHRSGLAKKVWSMESQEDVQRWRDERKKKFPTAETIAKKKQELEERIARGEVLETKNFSCMRGGRGRGARGRGRGQNGRGRGGRGRNSHHKDLDMPAEDKEEMIIKKVVTVESSSDDSSSDSDDGPPQEVKIVRKVVVEGADKQGDKKQGEATVVAGDGEDADCVVEADETPTEKKDKSVLESGSPNTTSLGLLSSYGFSSSEDECDMEEEREVSKDVHQTVKDSDYQPSPAKRQRLIVSNPSVESDVIGESVRSDFAKKMDDIHSNKPQHLDSSDAANQTSTLPENNHHLDVNGSDVDINKPQNGSCDLESPASVNPEVVADVKVKSPTETAEEINSPANDAEEMEEGEVAEEEADEKATTEDCGRHNKRGKRKNNNSASNNRRKANKQGGNQGGGNLPKYTLLEKLLAPDIRRERNKILQCVHYIVKNKFFDDMTKPAQQ